MNYTNILSESTIYDFLHNPNEIFLEGTMVDEKPDTTGFLFNGPDGTCVRLLKVPVDENISELYVQEVGYGNIMNSDADYWNRKDISHFDRRGFILNSSLFWVWDVPIVAACTRLESENFELHDAFWNAFANKALKEFEIDSDFENRDDVKEIANQYAILAMLDVESDYVNHIVKALKKVYLNSRANDIELALNYGLNPKEFIDELMHDLRSRAYDNAAIPTAIAAARLAAKISASYIADKNESQRMANQVAEISYSCGSKKTANIVIGKGSNGGVNVKVPLDSLFFYKPETKEVFINLNGVKDSEREKVNRYVERITKDAEKNLVPMSLVRCVNKMLVEESFECSAYNYPQPWMRYSLRTEL